MDEAENRDQNEVEANDTEGGQDIEAELDADEEDYHIPGNSRGKSKDSKVGSMRV